MSLKLNKFEYRMRINVRNAFQIITVHSKCHKINTHPYDERMSSLKYIKRKEPKSKKKYALNELLCVF